MKRWATPLIVGLLVGLPLSLGGIQVQGGRDGFRITGARAGPEQQGAGVAWVARYNGPGNGNDCPKALAVDDLGCVYVTGYSPGSATGLDYATVKYDANGNQIWVARYNGPGNGSDIATALALDSQGNVYVTGYSEGAGTGADYATIKYDTNGNQVWVARYNGYGNGSDSAIALAVDGLGNVYVTGYSEWDWVSAYATIKYDTNGNQKWVARYNGYNAGCSVSALAVDGLGNVYVTGTASDGSKYPSNYATVKYDASGNQIWAAIYDGGGGTDSAAALAVDGHGNVYVTGDSHRVYTPPVGYGIATIKYDPDGNQIWLAFYAPEFSDNYGRALTLDGQGNVYVTGGSSGISGSFYATIKYDTDGNQKWLASYNGGSNSTATALALDSQGNVYVTGYAPGVGTGYDYATIKYDAIGNQIWLARYNGSGNGNDYANALAVDGQGNIYVTGNSTGVGTGRDYATIKYHSAQINYGRVNGALMLLLD